MPSYTVEAVQRQDRMIPDGGTRQVYIAWIRTDLGASGRVTVPVKVWESGDLAGHLQAEADNLDKAFAIVD